MERMEQGSETFWGNVRKMVQVNMLQQRGNLLGAIIGCGIYSVFMAVGMINTYYHTNDMEYYNIINVYNGIFVLGIFFMLLSVYKTFSDERISMYPGTVMSRLVAKLFADHLRMLLYLVGLAVFYAIHYGLLWIFLQGSHHGNVEIICDIRGLGVGLLCLYLIMAVLHTGLLFFFACDAKFGVKAVMGGAALLLLALVFLRCFQPEVLRACERLYQRWIGGNRNLFECIAVFLGIMLTGLLLTFLVAKHIRGWRKSHIETYITVFGMGIIIFFVGMFFLLPEDFYEESSIQYESDDTSERLYGSVLADFPENVDSLRNDSLICLTDEYDGRTYESISEYIPKCTYMYTSVSEAETDELMREVDLSGVDEDHVMVVCSMPNIQVNGREIYRDVMEVLQEHMRPFGDKKNLRIECLARLRPVVQMTFMPSAERFLCSEENSMNAWNFEELSPTLSVCVVMSDARYAALDF